MEYRTGIFTNALIWFGVAISVSEIEAGIQLASMSEVDLWVPLILGHIIGGIMLFFVGLIGARVRVNAMESITSTFGDYGSKFFAALNVAQLLAWVAVLNAQGTMALMGLNLPVPFYITSIILAVLVSLWVYVGLQKSSRITTVVMLVLTVLLVMLTVKLFMPGSINTVAGSRTLGFWNIFEISIAMPISWLPVISDYTKDVEKPLRDTAASAIAYTIASLWMYIIGIEVVGFGTTSISQAILMSGLGTVGIIILVLSTVTTNFLAANSSGESAKAIYAKLDPKIAGMIISILSAFLAISGIMNHYINFLYLIASVFAPMAAVLLVSFYLVKSEGNKRVWCWNIFSWFIGFIVYQLTVNMDSVFLGPTLLAVITSAILASLQLLTRKNH